MELQQLHVEQETLQKNGQLESGNQVRQVKKQKRGMSPRRMLILQINGYLLQAAWQRHEMRNEESAAMFERLANALLREAEVLGIELIRSQETGRYRLKTKEKSPEISIQELLLQHVEVFFEQRVFAIKQTWAQALAELRAAQNDVAHAAPEQMKDQMMIINTRMEATQQLGKELHVIEVMQTELLRSLQKFVSEFQFPTDPDDDDVDFEAELGL